MMELSKRLSAVAGEVTRGNVLADVGTDHGYIPIYLLLEGVIPKAIAMDVNQGPLDRAKEHMKEHGLEAVMETRLSNGLQRLEPQEADSIVIAGMGGALMTEILDQGQHVIKAGKELILQPQSEVFKVRHFLHDHGYQIIKEHILKEEGKYYFILKAIPGSQRFSEEFLYEYGEYLLLSQNPLMEEYLQRELGKYKKILEGLVENASEAAAKRREQVQECMLKLEKAYHYGR